MYFGLTPDWHSWKQHQLLHCLMHRVLAHIALIFPLSSWYSIQLVDSVSSHVFFGHKMLNSKDMQSSLENYVLDGTFA